MLDNTVTKSEALWFAKRDALRNANRTKPYGDDVFTIGVRL